MGATGAVATPESRFDFGAPSKVAESSGAGTKDELDAAGATGFEGTGAGDEGFTATVLELPFAAGCSTFCASGRAGATEPFPAAGVSGAACGPGPIRSLGKRMPQKPTAGSVNSNST